MLALPVTLPLAAARRRRSTASSPQLLNAYPSMAVLLAEEQLAGRLRVSLPTRSSTSSELRTPEMTARHRGGVRRARRSTSTRRPKGLWGGECERHDGLHLFEDMTSSSRTSTTTAARCPTASPARGCSSPTSINRVQPLIRLEITDAMTLDRAAVPVRAHAARASSAVEGRS